MLYLDLMHGFNSIFIHHTMKYQQSLAVLNNIQHQEKNKWLLGKIC